MHARLCLLACALPACFKEIHRPGCSEPVVTELADDAVSPTGVSADDLLALATPGWEGLGVDATESEVDIAFAVARADGPAAFLDTEPIEVVTRVFGLGDESLLIAVECRDSLEVPVAFTLISDEAEIDLDMDATLSTPVFSTQPEIAANISGSQPYEQSGVIVPGIDETYEDPSIGVRVEIADDGRSAGSVSWIGTDDDHGQLVPMLRWSL